MSSLVLCSVQLIDIITYRTKIPKVLVIVRSKESEMCTNLVYTIRVEVVSMEGLAFREKLASLKRTKSLQIMENFQDIKQLDEGIKDKG